MPVISNTSPILNLAIIGKLWLLHEQFGEIIIPAAVHAELRLSETLPGGEIVRKAIDEKWIKRFPVKIHVFACINLTPSPKCLLRR